MEASAQSILTFNAGSSSLRFAVFNADCARSLEGKFERIGRPEARLILNGEESPRAVALLDAGAYGYTMASRYNGRALPAEVFVEGGAVSVVYERQAEEEWVADRAR